MFVLLGIIPYQHIDYLIIKRNKGEIKTVMTMENKNGLVLLNKGGTRRKYHKISVLLIFFVLVVTISGRVTSN
ncbi:hypothetical protein BSYN_13850 [Bacteroides sedimenti]|uniref:Uncharacterized protein n=1 Tax=Bacteroides sedimenti TaxID=2136147 RepID=A0ABN6Z3K7_9BACE